jgi:outer membrane lipase/esterase
LFKRLVLLGTVLSAALVSGETLNVNGIVAFGDSLSDTGNIGLATGGILPGPATNYAPGEFTNSPFTSPASPSPTGIWLDQLAPKLGLSSPTAALAGGTNFAFGGSETLQGAGPGGIIPSLNTEVGLALAAGGGALPSNLLYSFWSGSNDILDHPGDLTIPAKAADDIYNQILAVYAAGGKTFLWFNLPPLGETPSGISAGPAAVAGLDYESTLFNAEMQLDIAKLAQAGVDVIPVDVNSLFLRIATDFQSGCTVGAADPYCFANITDPAQGTSADPNTYLYWDTVHPTTEGHMLIADAAYDAILAAPEPGSIALAAAGLFGLLIAGRKRLGKQFLGN